MAVSPTVNASQFDTTIVSEISSDINVSIFDTVVVYNIPSEEIQTSQFDVITVVDRVSIPVEVSQLDVTVIYRGVIDNPSVRAWTFTLDGHDFYVLRLGNDTTFVYDLFSQQWSVWGSGSSRLWNVNTGTNWIGANVQAETFGSNVVVGSSINGSLFFLDPDKVDDDSAIEPETTVPFRRRLIAQVPLRGYDRARVYEIQVLGSVGQLSPGAGTSVELFYSDNRGLSYVSAGVINTPNNDFDVRASWRSLGSFQSPGRLFRLQDFGALQRVDSFTINSSLGEK